ncbi:hypothetical protein [Lignipirellula cremea]|uniref:Uncharacterized protein n=1 Tax=Lignipirellula cremea TaxID=2528010 RepID=A0A518DUV9_9BACT|nr:hypothetical protein [Lignipirellula cremea]QDU95620.1 hypothetical protein Pla8534_34360 [Lignipirellula cremea]
MSDKKHQHHQHPPARKPHKDWRLWAVVLLILVSMAVYVLSMDESLRPGGAGPEEPAAVEAE